MAEPPLIEGADQLREIMVLPRVAARPVGTPGAARATLVSVKAAEDPADVAVTVYEPTVAFAVNVVVVATPLVFVVADVVRVPLAKVPLAPLPGAVKRTAVGTSTGLPCESSRMALKAAEN